jgi:methionine aminotransferase
MTPTLDSKLPHVGTTIFTVMSALAQEHQAVNLGQGFPDFACDPQLVQHVTNAMLEGLNQYPSMLGVPELRGAVAKKLRRFIKKPTTPTARSPSPRGRPRRF